MSSKFDRRTLLKGIGSSAEFTFFSESDPAIRAQDVIQGSTTVKALVFDTFGTIGDWRSSVIAEGVAWGKAHRSAVGPPWLVTWRSMCNTQ